MKWQLWAVSGAGAIVAACSTPTPVDISRTVTEVETEATTAPVDLTENSGVRSCRGEEVIRGRQRLAELSDGSLVTMAPMQVNADGAPNAYHPDNAEGGAILHLCNAGKVYLPDGTSYHGSESNETCTGKFMDDVAKIKEAGWDDPEVGAVNWYGIYATGRVRIGTQFVQNVKPPLTEEGFYISPTALEDRGFAPDDQRRYVNAITVPHAVVRRDSGVELGTFGVAWRTKDCPGGRVCDPVPFIVADIGPKIGEGSIALTRLVNGLEVTEDITRENRFQGAVSDEDDVMWVFFGGRRAPTPYTPGSVERRAEAAFEAWGGEDRLAQCLRVELPVANAQ
ncbi:hypothetical protein [Parvularcula marina]|uniref:hypothetical protein n=1 Tax=Parvularcula marina TaxID=2292771 RepID=UPI003511D013